MKALWTLLALSILNPNLSLAQEVETKQPPPGISRTPPAKGSDGFIKQRVRGSVWIGEAAPQFELDASDGHRMRISELHGSWVLLLFAERKEHLAQYNSIEPELRDHGIRMIGVCDEKGYHLLSYAEKGRTSFPLLGDVTNEVSSLYGLYDPILGSIQPGFFVIDEEGIVQMALLGRELPGKDIASLAKFAQVREPE